METAAIMFLDSLDYNISEEIEKLCQFYTFIRASVLFMQY